MLLTSLLIFLNVFSILLKIAIFMVLVLLSISLVSVAKTLLSLTLVVLSIQGITKSPISMILFKIFDLKFRAGKENCFL